MDGKKLNAEKPKYPTIQELESDRKGFDALSRILKDHAGINLLPTSKNFTLLSTRVHKVLKKHNLNSYGQFLRVIKSNAEMMTEFIQCMTTNTTHFFREKEHFNVLANHIGEILNMKQSKRNHELRVWCAAASRGDEPYTIAMSLYESIPNINSWNLKFLATDIDANVLEIARQGVYESNQTKEVPSKLLEKYFKVQPLSNGNKYYHVIDKLKQAVTYAEFNLLEPRYPFNKKFDVIFCRNVLIYFDQDTVRGVINKLVDQLSPGGFLFIGHSESGTVRHEKLERIAPAAYRKLP